MADFEKGERAAANQQPKKAEEHLWPGSPLSQAVAGPGHNRRRLRAWSALPGETLFRRNWC
jgi:hypothetical protein